MVHGNFAHGDYFIDCGPVSLPVARAIFGAWITVYIAILALCVRSVYRSILATRLLAERSHVNLWHVAPAANLLEVVELRHVLVRSFTRGGYFFVSASLVCIATAVLSAASTTIANHAILENVVQRTIIVQGRLVTSEHATIGGANVNITNRVAALDYANAPLEQLFDFSPDDQSRWVFVAEQWNNTWSGRCTYTVHPAVDLVVYPTNSTFFQDEVPLLGSWLPQWVNNSTYQGTAYAGFYTNAAINGSGSWRDMVVTYVFGIVPPGDIGGDYSTVNISFANYLAHEVARDPNTTYFQTAFKSDVHVADCIFDNVTPGAEDQAYGHDWNYANAASGISSVTYRSVVDASIAQQTVIQPTAQQMVRYWQAYSSVKDAQYPHPVERALSVRRPVVQIRISVLVATIGTLLLAMVAAVLSWYAVFRHPRGRHFSLPSSQLGWVTQAMREHQRGEDVFHQALSPAKYSAQHADASFVVAPSSDGTYVTWINLPSESHTK